MGFEARNKSIIVDLMYGQLKSTVTCLTCDNVSITFDPYLTLSVPIPRPLKLTVYYMPLKQVMGKSPVCQVMLIPMLADSTIEDLQLAVC